MVLTFAQAEEFADRIAAFIPVEDPLGARRHFHFDRIRLNRSLGGLREVDLLVAQGWLAQSPSVVLWLRTTFSADLIELGRVYGVEP